MTAGAITTATDIIESAKNIDSLKIFSKAVRTVDLDQMIHHGGPFTVFAPSDDAFSALPEGSLAGLLKNRMQMSDVLLYHIVTGRITIDAMAKMKYASTLQGEDVSFNMVRDRILVNNAKILKADIECSNGVLHIIDLVLIPGL